MANAFPFRFLVCPVAMDPRAKRSLTLGTVLTALTAAGVENPQNGGRPLVPLPPGLVVPAVGAGAWADGAVGRNDLTEALWHKSGGFAFTVGDVLGEAQARKNILVAQAGRQLWGRPASDTVAAGRVLRRYLRLDDSQAARTYVAAVLRKDRGRASRQPKPLYLVTGLMVAVGLEARGASTSAPLPPNAIIGIQVSAISEGRHGPQDAFVPGGTLADDGAETEADDGDDEAVLRNATVEHNFWPHADSGAPVAEVAAAAFGIYEEDVRLLLL